MIARSRAGGEAKNRFRLPWMARIAKAEPIAASV